MIPKLANLQKRASIGSALTPIGNVLLKPVELLFGLPLARVKPLYDMVSFPMAAALSYQAALPFFTDKFPTEAVYTRAVAPDKLLSFSPYKAQHFSAVVNTEDEASPEIQNLRRKQEEEAKKRLVSEAGSDQITLESMFKNIDAQTK